MLPAPLFRSGEFSAEVHASHHRMAVIVEAGAAADARQRVVAVIAVVILDAGRDILAQHLFVTGAHGVAVAVFRTAGWVCDREAGVGVTATRIKQAFRRYQPAGTRCHVDGAARFEIEGGKAVGSGAAGERGFNADHAAAEVEIITELAAIGEAVTLGADGGGRHCAEIKRLAILLPADLASDEGPVEVLGFLRSSRTSDGSGSEQSKSET